MISNEIVLSFDDLSQYLIKNRLSERPESGQQLVGGLSLDAFLNGLIKTVANNPDKYDSWSDVLLDIIDNNMVTEEMVSQVITITAVKTKSDLIPNRVFSCKMLSKLTQRVDEKIFIEQLLPLVQYLCRDFLSIRALISKYLSVLSLNLSLQTIKSYILPEVLELTKDTEMMVRIAAIESLIDLISKLDVETNNGIVLPQIVLFFNSSVVPPNDSYLSLIFIHFGKLCQNLPNDVMSEEKWFLNYYFNVFLVTNDIQANCKDRDIQCRTLLALFFPILLRIYGLNEILYTILDLLCSDIDVTVVQTIASVFNQIVDYLGIGFKLYSQLSKLLRQRSVVIIKELEPFLSHMVIDVIKSAPIDCKNILFEDIITNLIGCENTICLSLDWRFQIKFYECLSAIMPYLPLEAIKTHFIALLMNRILTTRPIPLRIASSRCLISLFTEIPVLLEVLNIYEWFVITLCHGKSWSQRMLFLNVCQIVDELCDKQIMISYLLEPLLNLRKDKVPNIRLNVCKKFKAFKHLLKSSEINARIDEIKAMFRQMLNTETDVDVIESINQMVTEFDWKSDFDKLEVEELTENFDLLTIDGSIAAEVNNNCIDVKEESNLQKSDLKFKSSLPQLIRSQLNTNSIIKCLPINHINTSGSPSRIPKPITKCSK